MLSLVISVDGTFVPLFTCAFSYSLFFCLLLSFGAVHLQLLLAPAVVWDCNESTFLHPSSDLTTPFHLKSWIYKKYVRLLIIINAYWTFYTLCFPDWGKTSLRHILSRTGFTQNQKLPKLAQIHKLSDVKSTWNLHFPYVGSASGVLAGSPGTISDHCVPWHSRAPTQKKQNWDFFFFGFILSPAEALVLG